jgi:hypothetical protein
LQNDMDLPTKNEILSLTRIGSLYPFKMTLCTTLYGKKRT